MMERQLRHNGADIDRAIHSQPDPVAVAKLFESHGAEAVYARWWYLSDRTLGKLAQIGRVRTGIAPAHNHGRATQWGAEDRAVAMEAAYALGSCLRGERAAGIGVNGGRAEFERRGLDPVGITHGERGRTSRLTARAKVGDAEAAAAIEAQHALERAVGDVIRAALRIVPDQPPFGRYRLPEPGDELAAAVAGLDPVAVDLVFRKPCEPVPTESEPPPEIAQAQAGPKRPALAVIRRDYVAGKETAAVLAERYGVTPAWLVCAWRRLRRDEGVSRLSPKAHRKVPSDAVMRADHSTGGSLNEIARRYRVSPAALFMHWRRLGLPPLNAGFRRDRA